jgi:hypothetical protein
MTGGFDFAEFLDAGEFEIIIGGIGELAARLPGVIWNEKATLFHYQQADQDSYYVLSFRDIDELLGLRYDLGQLRLRIETMPTTPTIGMTMFEDPETFVQRISAPASPAVVIRSGAVAGVIAPSLPDELRGADPGGAMGIDADEPLGYGDPTIRRTPHLDAPETLSTVGNSLISVDVRIDEEVMAEEEYGADVVIEAPETVRQITVQVELVASAHFTIVGPAEQDMVIDRDQPKAKPVHFTVTVVEKPPRRPAGMLALIKYRGRPCGHVSRAWDWVAGQAEAPSLPGHAVAAASLPIHVDTIRPDITVTITAPVADGQHFFCGVRTSLVPGYESGHSQEFGLPTSAATFVATALADLIDGKATPAQRRRNLEKVGYRLWNAVPPNLKEMIWAIFEADAAPASLYIATAEPTLPWELMIPHRNIGGVFEERKPLGLEFAIGRWTRGDAASPPQRMPLRNSFVIAPQYRPERVLESAEVETAFVMRRLNGSRIDPATVDNLNAHFATNWASLLHFVCHGAADDGNDPAIYLDREEPLHSDGLYPLGGFKALCRKRAPVVFLNACEAGLTLPAIVGSAGFPAALGDLGARAIVAPLWPVDDRLAHRIAMDLYERALAPHAPPVAEILRQIRAEAYEKDDADTYAAYAFYGDPLATLEMVPA